MDVANLAAQASALVGHDGQFSACVQAMLTEKITVIDGAIGYTGGMNIGREHLSSGAGFSSPRRKTNRDTTQPTGPDQG
jgi:phosphatidylserine/phosphatidylglycerophosphate/cardiolipin synthase-like enzyme